MIKRENHPKVRVSRTACFSTARSPGPKVATTLDLSVRGTRIETPHSLTKGDRIDISFAIDPRVIKCKGEVMDIVEEEGKRLKAEIRFEGLSEEDRLLLEEYVFSVVKPRL